jgi:hypothetical protein
MAFAVRFPGPLLSYPPLPSVCAPQRAPWASRRPDPKRDFAILLVPGERVELPTNGLQNRCSTAELTRQVGEISLYQRLLALWPAMARAHIARTSNVVPVQITVQFRSPADARFSGLFREAAARSRGIETLQPSTPERRQVCGLALVEAGMTTSTTSRGL